MKNELKKHAEDIFRAGLDRVNPNQLLTKVLSLSGHSLRIKTDSEEFSVDLNQFDKIKVIAFGKAAATMAASLCEILGEKIVDGIVICKEDVQSLLPSALTVITGSHPVPDEKSEDAGKLLLEFCKSCSEGELVLGLVSGGASSLIEVPGDTLTLNDMKLTTEWLLKSGAAIHEMNCIRKHLSKIKGGNLTQAIFPAISLNFILSDVIGDDLSAIGSGPTVADDTTFQDALDIISKYKLKDKLPSAIINYLQDGCDGKIVETIKSGDSRLHNTKNVLVGTNKVALKAARDKAQALGYETIILSDKIQGEACEAALKFYSFSREVEKGLMMKLPACILAGGETTVTLTGDGKGGRNQEMALAYLCLLQDGAELTKEQIFLSASTDGGDGPTDATGAFANAEILENAKKLKLDPEDYLERNDSYHFFKKAGGHLITGATGTNVCDLQVLIIR